MDKTLGFVPFMETRVTQAMKVDPTVVKMVADLAKLKVGEDEIDEYVASMTRILDLVEEMQHLDTTAVEPMANPTDAVARLRPDEVTGGDNRDRYQAAAPEVEGGLYLVPRVVE